MCRGSENDCSPSLRGRSGTGDRTSQSRGAACTSLDSRRPIRSRSGACLHLQPHSHDDPPFQQCCSSSSPFPRTMHVVFEELGGACKFASTSRTGIELTTHANSSRTPHLHLPSKSPPRKVGQSLSQPRRLPQSASTLMGTSILRNWSCDIGIQIRAVEASRAHDVARPSEGEPRSPRSFKALTRGGAVHSHASLANRRGHRRQDRSLRAGTPTPRCGVEGPARCCGDQPAQERVRRAR